MKSIIFDGVFGSNLYGTATPESDTDYKSIFIPEAREIVLNKVIKNYTNDTSNHLVKNTKDDVDREYFALNYFIDLAKKGETMAIDMLHTPFDLNLAKFDSKEHEVWQFIQKNRSKFYTTDMKTYLGYVKGQAAKYGIKGSRLAALRLVKDWADALPETKPAKFDMNQHTKNVSWVNGEMHQDTKIGEFFDTAPITAEHAYIDVVNGTTYFKVLTAAYQDTLSVKRFKMNINKAWNGYGNRARMAETNQGIDWKSLHHAVRGGMQLLEIYKTGDLKYPLESKDDLIRIKKGEIHFKIVSGMLESIVEDVAKESQLAAKNGMPSKVEPTFWDNFIYDVYGDVVVNANIKAQKDY